MAVRETRSSRAERLHVPAARQAGALRRALLGWFRLHARPLPWRKTHDPYAVWVSEVMLQQTQVATVIPYYLRFLRAFPTLRRLAEAPLERVLELWSGLGYYRRAGYLHRAAQIVAEKFGGNFPRDYALARSLPGVGEYTARAILSIAYNQPYAVLDGNVARVIARLLALRGNLHQPTFRRTVEAELQRLLSHRQPGAFNQTLMELGQTICLPRAPRCSVCPLHNWCQGYRLGNPEAYPAPRPRRAAEYHYLAAALIQRDDRVAMVRGLDAGLLGDLWNFPAAFGISRHEALARLRERLSAHVTASVTFDVPLAELHHGITYRSIHVHVYATAVPDGDRRRPFRWLQIAALNQAAISQLARKIAKRVL